MDIISCENVSFTYAGHCHPALRDFSLAIGAGQRIAVLGAGGSGKSTLCRLITGFIPSFFKGTLCGTCRIKGQDIQTWSPFDLHRLSGYLFQNSANQLSHVKFSVRAEIAFGLENLGVAPPDISRRVDSVMATLGIAHLADRNPLTLSGGELQKVALGAVLVMEPEILVMDEPATQLDPIATERVAKQLIQLNRSGGTVIVTQNAFNEFTAGMDRVILLDQGRLVTADTPAKVLCTQKMEAFGVTPPVFHICARMAKDQALWPTACPLPATLAEALAGFGKIMAKEPL